MFQNNGGAAARQRQDSGWHGFDGGRGVKVGLISYVTRESRTDHSLAEKNEKSGGKDRCPVARQELDAHGQGGAKGIEDAIGIRYRKGA
ncbi:hypothetical protein Cmtc_44290 [Cupriavidus sp. TKC]|nr:hypothetical protein Cmtc_44290 [Cupriavidus sp. TKC]